MMAKLVLLLLVSVLLVQNLHAAAFGKTRSFNKYLYKAQPFREEGIHPSWWKRASLADPADDEGDDEPNMISERASRPFGTCHPKNWWKVRDKICIPFICVMDDAARNEILLNDGDCVCMLPYFGCKIWQ